MCTWMTSCETLPVPPFFNPPPIPHIVSFPTLSFGNLVFSLHASPLFTPLAVPLFFLSRGHNQRMEFLGDSIMQLVATEYLFIHFPDHHEGHLTVRSNHLKHSPKAFFPPAAMYFSHLPLLHPCLVFIPPSPAFYIIWGVIFLSPPSSLLINLWSSSFFFLFFLLFCFHSSLPLTPPHAVPVCLLYSSWWVSSWDGTVQWFSATHLCWHIFAKAVKCLKNKVACARTCTACTTGTKQMITLWTRKSIFRRRQTALRRRLFSRASALLFRGPHCWRLQGSSWSKNWIRTSAVIFLFYFLWIFHDVIFVKASSELWFRDWKLQQCPRVKTGYIWNGFQIGRKKKCPFN